MSGQCCLVGTCAGLIVQAGLTGCLDLVHNTVSDLVELKRKLHLSQACLFSAPLPNLRAQAELARPQQHGGAEQTGQPECGSTGQEQGGPGKLIRPFLGP